MQDFLLMMLLYSLFTLRCLGGQMCARGREENTSKCMFPVLKLLSVTPANALYFSSAAFSDANSRRGNVFCNMI